MSERPVDTFIFPASGPAFIGNKNDRFKVGNINNPTWLLGASAGAYRVMSSFFDTPIDAVIDGLCDMTWYPWRFQGALTKMMDSLTCKAIPAECQKLDTPSKLIPVIFVTHTHFNSLFTLVVCVIASFVGFTDLIYHFAELLVYTPPWAPRHDFPLAFDTNPHLKVRFRDLTSANVKQVLYNSSRLPGLAVCREHNMCDGGILFYYLNGRVKDGHHALLLGDTTIDCMSPAFTDYKRLNQTNLTVVQGHRKNNLIDWFYPLYLWDPELRKQKWKRHDE
jgi:hypothetical protein